MAESTKTKSMMVAKGLFVCVLLVAVGVTSPTSEENGGCRPIGMKPFDYSQALCMSFLFYESLRSGALPNDMRIKWRGDSALNDGQDNGVDLSGGYYAGGRTYMKYGFLVAFTATALSWGLLAYPGGFIASDQTDYARVAIRWATDYFLKAHTDRNELWSQVGLPSTEYEYWGRPEDMTHSRPSSKIDKNCPGSDLAGETSAALAAASIVFKDVDPTYSKKLLNASIELFTFADNYRGEFHMCSTVSSFYRSNGYGDELAWSALWLYKATGVAFYLDRAKGFVKEFQLDDYSGIFDWNYKALGVYALLAELDGDESYGENLKRKIDQKIAVHWEDKIDNPYSGMVIQEDESPYLGLVANVAFIAARAASLGLNSSYNAWAQKQLDAMLGSTGRSYVVGFGVNPPKNPTHSASSCPGRPAFCDWSNYFTNNSNPQTVFGALVSGPTKHNTFLDDRKEGRTLVASYYNALYTGLLAAMIEENIKSTLCTLIANLKYCS